MGCDPPTDPRPPLRADAARNLDRILSAGRAVFAEKGLDASVDEIARRAGVGHATVYRRFPTKEDLIVGILEQSLTESVTAAEVSAAADDPVEGLLGIMATGCTKTPEARAFFDAAGCRFLGADRLTPLRERLVDALAGTLSRAQDEGRIRPDVRPGDILLLVQGVARAVPDSAPDLWRRYLTIVLDGLRASAATPLAPDPPDLEELLRAEAWDPATTDAGRRTA